MIVKLRSSHLGHVQKKFNSWTGRLPDIILWQSRFYFRDFPESGKRNFKLDELSYIEAVVLKIEN